MLELTIIGVRVELPANQPIVLLKETAGERYLPIWIGPAEATAIAAAQQGLVPPRPLTHDLLRDVIAALGATLTAVHITELRDSVFYAELVLSTGVRVSARPSDAIALALRADAPVLAAAQVIDDAGIVVTDDQETEVERFREFLDNITAEDFIGPEES